MRPPLVLSLWGDLVYMKTADDVRSRLSQADDDGRPMVVLQTRIRRWRPDVVLELIRAIRASKVPVSVHICDADFMASTPTELPSSVGAGVLMIGLAAQSCVVAPNVKFVQARTDTPLELAPDRTDWETINAELRDATAESLRRRGISEEVAEPLARALVSPREPLRLIQHGEPAAWRIAVNTADADKVARPGAPVLSITQTGASGDPVTRLDQTAVRRLGLIDAEAVDLDAWLRKTGVSARKPDREPITPEVIKLPYFARGRLQFVDKQIEAGEKLLELPDTSKHAVSRDKYHEAAANASDALLEAEKSLSAAESLLNDYPELLRTAPPGQTEVGAKPSSFAAKWRSMIQSRRDKLAKLKAKAEAFAGQ